MTQNLTERSDEFRNDLLQKLRTDIVNVEFTKADGSARKMRCTLLESSIPPEKRPKQTEIKEASSTIGSAVRVFDTEKGEWRSFRWESVVSINNVGV